MHILKESSRFISARAVALQNLPQTFRGRERSKRGYAVDLLVMAFSASLSRFHGLVSQAISQASPTDSDTGESFPVNGSKDDVARCFQGAIFKLKATEGYAFASAPVARLTGGAVELVFSGAQFNSARK